MTESPRNWSSGGGTNKEADKKAKVNSDNWSVSKSLKYIPDFNLENAFFGFFICKDCPKGLTPCFLPKSFGSSVTKKWMLDMAWL